MNIFTEEVSILSTCSTDEKKSGPRQKEKERSVKCPMFLKYIFTLWNRELRSGDYRVILTGRTIGTRMFDMLSSKLQDESPRINGNNSDETR